MVLKILIVAFIFLVAAIDIVMVSICRMAEDEEDDREQAQWCREWEEENSREKCKGAAAGADSGDAGGRIV